MYFVKQNYDEDVRPKYFKSVDMNTNTKGAYIKYNGGVS